MIVEVPSNCRIWSNSRKDLVLNNNFLQRTLLRPTGKQENKTSNWQEHFLKDTGNKYSSLATKFAFAYNTRLNWTAGKMFDGTVLSRKHKNLGYSSSVSIAINTSFALRTFVQIYLPTLIVDILWKNNNDKKSFPLSTGVAKSSGIIFLRRLFKFAHPHETGQQMFHGKHQQDLSKNWKHQHGHL